MKKFIALSLTAALFISCQSPIQPQTQSLPTNPDGIVSTDYAPPIEELLGDTTDLYRANAFIYPMENLIENKNKPYEYSSHKAADQNLSTAWCANPDEEHKSWIINFNELTTPTATIFPGYAATEELYFENNRIKEILAVYDHGEATTLTLEDKFEMQELDLPKDPTQSVRLVVNEVYPGSKYDDTCISEINFWGDEIEIEKENSSSPLVTDLKMIAPDALSYCGAFDPNTYTKEGEHYTANTENEYGYKNSFSSNGQNSWWTGAGNSLSLSAEVESATTKDKFTLRWWEAPLNMDTGSSTWSVKEEQTVYPQACDDGRLFISAPHPTTDLPGPFVRFSVEILYEDEVIGASEFSFVQ